MLNLSRARIRTLIVTELEADNPGRHRWVQEHPSSAAIVNQLTSDAIDLMIDANRDRHQTAPTGFWASVTETEIEATVIEMVLGSPDLWETIDEEFPRTPTSASSDATMHNLMGEVSLVPRSAPTGNGSPRGA